ncbi:hypothetical protein KW850_03515 [Bacillus sp. sid0103]|uniref:hypothetical protein n=1 Tax=Bacillus sp. sid0103 TaxID=2856337 RepID=UPI001C47C387|nr:hypothetical protein [Bacillus sp. sid0103]MBV7504332.1 hypothetical protein [Bacillus sp. sid0103]
MSKKILMTILCLGLIVGIYFLASRPTKPASPTIPTTSLEERICEKVSSQFGDCKKILLFDTNSNLVFAESSTGIIPVLTNKGFTEFKKFIYPELDFQEFNEEKEERGPIDWRAKNNVQKDFSVIYGFAGDDAKTIVINSEGNIQPNRFFVRNNLWVWYATFQKDKVKLPVKVTVYDANGQIIFGGNEKE